MVAAGGVVRCRWTAVAVVLMMAWVAIAAGSGSEGSNETRATWEVRFAASAAYMEKLVAPLLLCVGRRLLINRLLCARSGRTWRSSRGIVARGARDTLQLGRSACSCCLVRAALPGINLAFLRPSGSPCLTHRVSQPSLGR